MARFTEFLLFVCFSLQVAVLVQGNWVVKSDVLYPKDKMCGVSGIAHDVIAKARDHLVLGPSWQPSFGFEFELFSIFFCSCACSRRSASCTARP